MADVTKGNWRKKKRLKLVSQMFTLQKPLWAKCCDLQKTCFPCGEASNFQVSAVSELDTKSCKYSNPMHLLLGPDVIRALHVFFMYSFTLLCVLDLISPLFLCCLCIKIHSLDWNQVIKDSQCLTLQMHTPVWTLATGAHMKKAMNVMQGTCQLPKLYVHGSLIVSNAIQQFVLLSDHKLRACQTGRCIVWVTEQTEKTPVLSVSIYSLLSMIRILVPSCVKGSQGARKSN